MEGEILIRDYTKKASTYFSSLQKRTVQCNTVQYNTVLFLFTSILISKQDHHGTWPRQDRKTSARTL